MQILCFLFFYSRAAVSVVFRPCCPVQVLSFALCLHHVFVSEQIKMMKNFTTFYNGRPIESHNDLWNDAIFNNLKRPLPPGFKVTSFFDAEYLRIGTRYRQSLNGILIGTCTRPQLCRFEWSWVSLSDLTKYLITRSVARSLRQLSFLFPRLDIVLSLCVPETQ